MFKACLTMENFTSHYGHAIRNNLHLQNQVSFENNDKRKRVYLPRRAKVIIQTASAEPEERKEYGSQAVFHEKSPFYSKEESSTTYIPSTTSSSDLEEYTESEYTADEEDEVIGDNDFSPHIQHEDGQDCEFKELYSRSQIEDHVKCTLTMKTFDSTVETNGCFNFIPNISRSSACKSEYNIKSCEAEGSEILQSLQNTQMKAEGNKRLFSGIQPIEDDGMKIDDMPFSRRERNSIHYCNIDYSLNDYCDASQMSPDYSYKNCIVCEFLDSDDTTPVTSTTSSQVKHLKQVILSPQTTTSEELVENEQGMYQCYADSIFSHQCRLLNPRKKNGPDSLQKHEGQYKENSVRCNQDKSESLYACDVCSDSDSSSSYQSVMLETSNGKGGYQKISMSLPPKELNFREQRRVEHRVRPCMKQKTDNGNFLVKSHNRCTKDRSRSSKAEEKEKIFHDLFTKILNHVHELTSVKVLRPISFTEEKQNEVKWDPIIFYEKERSDDHIDSSTQDETLKDLWKDMESACQEMHGLAALEEHYSQLSQDTTSYCNHNLVLNEKEGRICLDCGLLAASIENIWPPVFKKKGKYKDPNSKSEIDGEAFTDTFKESTWQENVKRRSFQIDMTSILNSISDLRPVMKKNQLEGFKFLWKNIGPLGGRSDSEGGGCIIAHAPGTGKSLLIISFLKSYLHMDPSCRPLIVAPKNMLLPWHKEFEKWKVNVKVLMLRSSMHSSLDYLKTISEWQRSTSVLIVTYQLFAKLVEDGKACRRLHIQQIGSLLLYIPDILIMDEGHVPRNCSMLRDSLLQIRTRFKILVSGTLFQNNTQELFNLLYLARPSFLDHLQADTCIQRLDKLHLEGNRKQWQTFEEFDSERWNNKTKEQVESIACKIFMEEIGNRLEDEADRSGSDNGFKNAIEKLRALTAPFIHIYNGDLLKTLPGIREFIVYLQATSLQVSLSTQIKNQTFLETSLSVHPSLLLKWKGAGLPSCVNAKELEALRRDASQAPKLSFILALADCCSVLKEKLLIFSQFVQTLDLVEELMKSKFKVVSIKGRDGLEERQRVMDEFNESTNTSILLASITACGEGINLTGASRVVFLDMHWNPARMRQASARAFRIGQKRVVYTYWLIASIEKEAEKLKRVQRKDWLSRSIFALDNEVTECHQQEDLQHNQEEDHVLEYLLKNDANKSILKAVSYGASDRKMHPVFCE